MILFFFINDKKVPYTPSPGRWICGPKLGPVNTPPGIEWIVDESLPPLGNIPEREWIVIPNDKWSKNVRV